MLPRLRCIAMLVMTCGLALPAQAEGARVLLQSTTSTQNSGLYDHLLPQFTDATGFRVDVVAVGTGQAIRNARNGDADVLLVHAIAAEEAFVAEGWGVERFDLMYNDFVIVGPGEDPAGLADAGSLTAALTLLKSGAGRFISRGDDSGTHAKELALWARLAGGLPGSGDYLETGSGMGATLRVAVEMEAYTLTDRATWLAYGAPLDHRILVEGDAELFNQYGIMAVNPLRHAHVNAAGADALIQWLRGEAGQAAIAAYQVEGQQLFFPNAGP